MSVFRPCGIVLQQGGKTDTKSRRIQFVRAHESGTEKTSREILENIRMYDEHCFSSWQSVSNPYSFADLSQTAEKNTYVYRALDGAQCLLSERARALTADDQNKMIIFNPSVHDKTVCQFMNLFKMRTIKS